jgi:hypothetical protein
MDMKTIEAICGMIGLAFLVYLKADYSGLEQWEFSLAVVAMAGLGGYTAITEWLKSRQ